MIGYGALGGQADQLKGSTSASTIQQVELYTKNQHPTFRV
jgi:hypothetical protein